MNYMTTSTTVLLSPPAEVINKLTLAEREEVKWYREMGMPISGTVVDAVKRVIKVRREMK